MVIVAICLYSAAGRIRPVVEAAHSAVTTASGSQAQRDLAPAGTWSLIAFVTAARRVIPRNATYAVVIGQDPPTDGLRVLAIPPLLWYSLAPRKYTQDIQAAQWVITYHHSPESLGVKVGREVGLDADGNAVQVAP